MKKTAIAFFLCVGLPASTQSMQSMQIASDLGTLLASEDLCGLAYDHDAIDRFIDDYVDPSDMSFASTLQMMTDGQTFMMGDMSEAAKRAHCRAIGRTARHHGFIE